MKQGLAVTSALVGFNADAHTRHRELLELVNAQTGSLDTLSSIGRSSFNSSSGSFSLLPGTPKIFHGRETELEDLIQSILTVPARVAILGPGGMGKTTLAVAALHNPKIVGKYPTRYFISCDSAYTNSSLVAMIASHLGLEPSRGLVRTVVHHLTAEPACLLILDNFETPWEAADGRDEVEEFLSLLTDVPHVGLLITMRGAERPSKVQWNRPFLQPLKPLSPTAARQTFIEIAEEIHNDEEVDQLLDIADNIPLAVQLIATVAASEGCQATLERWELEKTAMLSDGYDKKSNLEISIMLSLSSPRVSSLPQTLDLLSLMSLLSDGISNLDLAQSNLPIPEILKCKGTLIRTSLAYVDHVGRLKVLAPIRDYIRQTRYPSPALVRPLRKHLNDLLKLRKTFMLSHSSSAGDLTPRLTANLANLHNVLLHGLDSDPEDLRETILGILSLNRLNLIMGRGFTPLMLRLPELLDKTVDHELQGRFITEALEGKHFSAIPNPERSIEQAIEHFRIINDLEGEARLYFVVGDYYVHHTSDMKKAQTFFARAFSLASQCNSAVIQVRGLLGLSTIEWFQGNYPEGLRLARETHKMGVITGYVWGELDGIRWQAMCCTSLGDFKHALQLVDAAKNLLVWAGLRGGGADIRLMNTEALVYQLKTEYAKARHIQEAILRQTSAVLTPVLHAYALVNIVELDLVTGVDADIVSRNIDAAALDFQNARYIRGMAFVECSRADLLLREGNEREACTEYKRLFAGVQTTDNDIACACLAKLANPTNSTRTTEELTRWAIIFLAFTIRSAVHNMLAVHQALRCLADVFSQEGTDDVALSLLAVALEGFTWMDVHRSRGECMRTLGDVHFRRGEISRASSLWKDARPMFERSMQGKDVASIDARLSQIEQHHQHNLELLSRLSTSTTAPVSQLPTLLQSPVDEGNQEEKIAEAVRVESN
ncbi:hypothetical protein K438DRAFT_1976549 [Mycena galopus ATCC 62051]|nr:hypothetical protein K438DRAFT_1976549 [Mycena galopus ATCC 62051]